MEDPNVDSQSLANITLAIIAGGMGTRMGKPKAWLRIGNESILAWTLNRLRWPGPALLVTAPDVPPPPDRERFGNHVVDPVGGLGPLRGVLTALENATTALVITLAVDMPLIDAAQLTWLTAMLLARPDRLGVMCRVDRDGQEFIEPFPAVYRIASAGAISKQLHTGQRSLHKLCRDPRFVALPPQANWPNDVWTNLNDPAQFAAFEASMANPSPEKSN